MPTTPLLNEASRGRQRSGEAGARHTRATRVARWRFSTVFIKLYENLGSTGRRFVRCLTGCRPARRGRGAAVSRLPGCSLYWPLRLASTRSEIAGVTEDGGRAGELTKQTRGMSTNRPRRRSRKRAARQSQRNAERPSVFACWNSSALLNGSAEARLVEHLDFLRLPMLLPVMTFLLTLTQVNAFVADSER